MKTLATDAAQSTKTKKQTIDSLLKKVAIVVVATTEVLIFMKATQVPEPPKEIVQIDPTAANAAKTLITLAGYKCANVDFLIVANTPTMVANVRCEKYRYEIKDHGGRAVVTVLD